MGGYCCGLWCFSLKPAKSKFVVRLSVIFLLLCGLVCSVVFVTCGGVDLEKLVKKC